MNTNFKTSQANPSQWRFPFQNRFASGSLVCEFNFNLSDINIPLEKVKTLWNVVPFQIFVKLEALRQPSQKNWPKILRTYFFYSKDSWRKTLSTKNYSFSY